MELFCDWIPTVLAVFFILVVTTFFLLSRLPFHHKIALIPGYKDWPVVGDLLHLSRDPSEYYIQTLDVMEKCRKYGISKYRVAVWSAVFLLNPNEVEKLLRSNVELEKSTQYKVVQDWLGVSLLTSSGAKWKSRRRTLTPSFHFNILKDFLLIMTEQTDEFLKILESHSTTGQPFNVSLLITLHTLNIIGETAMGVRFDALRNKQTPYVEAVLAAKDLFFHRFRSPWLSSNYIYYLTYNGWKCYKTVKYLHEFTEKVIKERKESRLFDKSNCKYKPFLDTLLDCKDEEGQPLTDQAIREEVDTFMFEGHDTVSSGLSHTVYLLGRQLDEQRKCQQELDEIFETPRPITWDDLSKMTYLEWCIKESLRIYPPVPWYGRCLSTDMEFAGYVVPKGANIVIFPAILHRDPQHFPDPEKFDPLRFSSDNSVNRHPYCYLPFSAGSRNCIGQRFAMIELKVVLAYILRKFNIESTQTRSELRDNPGIVLEPSNGIWIKLSHRI